MDIDPGSYSTRRVEETVGKSTEAQESVGQTEEREKCCVEYVVPVNPCSLKGSKSRVDEALHDSALKRTSV